MKNIIIAMVFALLFGSFGYACDGNSCQVNSRQPVRKVVSVTKNIVAAPFVATKNVLKNRPVRSRLFSRRCCR